MWHHFNASFKRVVFCFFLVHCHYQTVYGSDTNILILIRFPEMNYKTTVLCTTFVRYISTLISSALAYFKTAVKTSHPAAACCPALSLNKVQVSASKTKFHHNVHLYFLLFRLLPEETDSHLSWNGKKNWRKTLLHLILIILEQTAFTEDSHRNPQCFANRVKLKNRKFNCILCFLSNLADLAQSTKTHELCATLFFFEFTLFKPCLHFISFLHVKVILQTTDAA